MLRSLQSLCAIQSATTSARETGEPARRSIHRHAAEFVRKIATTRPVGSVTFQPPWPSSTTVNLSASNALFLLPQRIPHPRATQVVDLDMAWVCGPTPVLRYGLGLQATSQQTGLDLQARPGLGLQATPAWVCRPGFCFSFCLVSPLRDRPETSFRSISGSLWSAALGCCRCDRQALLIQSAANGVPCPCRRGRDIRDRS